MSNLYTIFTLDSFGCPKNVYKHKTKAGVLRVSFSSKGATLAQKELFKLLFPQQSSKAFIAPLICPYLFL